MGKSADLTFSKDVQKMAQGTCKMLIATGDRKTWIQTTHTRENWPVSRSSETTNQCWRGCGENGILTHWQWKSKNRTAGWPCGSSCWHLSQEYKNTQLQRQTACLYSIIVLATAWRQPSTEEQMRESVRKWSQRYKRTPTLLWEERKLCISLQLEWNWRVSCSVSQKNKYWVISPNI